MLIAIIISVVFMCIIMFIGYIAEYNMKEDAKELEISYSEYINRRKRNEFNNSK